MKNIIIVAVLFLASVACQNKKQSSAEEVQKVVEGDTFSTEKSDAKAIKLADEVIDAHGGTENWNNTRYISWEFLGKRKLVWDKFTGNVRIDFPGEQSTYLINVNEEDGRVKIGDKMLTQNDSLDSYIEKGKQIWVNDSYWLVFPFKLKDPGVILSYIGQDTTKNGKTAEVIGLTFEQVGFTPQNKYKIYIDPATHLILQWDYYQKASDDEASFQLLCSDYQQYGDIMLSSGRGERVLGNIKVAQDWNESVFKDF